MTWEYIAGFFDGEGTIALRKEDKGYRIQIPQTNQRILEEIQEFTRFGRLCKVTKRKKHWKESWTYYIAKQEDIYIFLNHITPFLIVKHEQTVQALQNLRRILALQKMRKERFAKRYKRALQLREQGLSYHRIGLAMGLDRGYVRRLVLRS